MYMFYEELMFHADPMVTVYSKSLIASITAIVKT